jgi:glucose-1-phosphatase
MIKTILFDFGNVIGYFDHWKTLAKLAPYTDTPAQAMFDSLYGKDLEDRLETGKMTPDAFLAEVIELWKLRCDANFLHRAAVEIFTPNEAICSIIPQLSQNYRLVLASNTNVMHSNQYIMQFADTIMHFQHLVLSHEVGIRKPFAGFYKACQQHAHAEPHECVFVDDLQENIDIAKKHGWHGITYSPTTDIRAELATLGVKLSR